MPHRYAARRPVTLFARLLVRTTTTMKTLIAAVIIAATTLTGCAGAIDVAAALFTQLAREGGRATFVRTDTAGLDLQAGTRRQPLIRWTVDSAAAPNHPLIGWTVDVYRRDVPVGQPGDSTQ